MSTLKEQSTYTEVDYDRLKQGFDTAADDSDFQVMQDTFQTHISQISVK